MFVVDQHGAAVGSAWSVTCFRADRGRKRLSRQDLKANYEKCTNDAQHEKAKQLWEKEYIDAKGSKISESKCQVLSGAIFPNWVAIEGALERVMPSDEKRKKALGRVAIVKGSNETEGRVVLRLPASIKNADTGRQRNRLDDFINALRNNDVSDLAAVINARIEEKRRRDEQRREDRRNKRNNNNNGDESE